MRPTPRQPASGLRSHLILGGVSHARFGWPPRASAQGSFGGQHVLDQFADSHLGVSTAWVDDGYDNTVIRNGGQEGIQVEVVKRPAPKGSRSPRRSIVERALGWLTTKPCPALTHEKPYHH
ncbi:MAG: hypothetical protein M3422_08880 [Actinomycetota bacterium]|nr:hypothetical protein [Actinomycetota bacterium]